MRRKGNPPGKRTGFKLLVENLSSRTSWQDLKDYMRQAGEIMYTNTHNIRSGEGLVEFGSRSDMEWALDKLDNTELDGRKIRLIEDCKKSRSRYSGLQRTTLCINFHTLQVPQQKPITKSAAKHQGRSEVISGPRFQPILAGEEGGGVMSD